VEAGHEFEAEARLPVDIDRAKGDDLAGAGPASMFLLVLQCTSHALQPMQFAASWRRM